MKITQRACASLASGAIIWSSLVATAPFSSADVTYGKTAGGVAHTWMNYTNADGTEGPSVGAYVTIQVTW
jgi:hypothetical protein